MPPCRYGADTRKTKRIRTDRSPATIIILGEEIALDSGGQLYLRDRATVPVTTVPVVEVGLLARGQERSTAVMHGARRVGFAAHREEMSGGVFLGVRSAREGLIPVGVAVETPGDSPGRMMVIGDSDFLRGALGLRASNRMLLTHVLQWLHERNDRMPQVHERYAYAPLSVRQARYLFWVSMLPAMGFFAIGVIAWWRRSG